MRSPEQAFLGLGIHIPVRAGSNLADGAGVRAGLDQYPSAWAERQQAPGDRTEISYQSHRVRGEALERTIFRARAPWRSASDTNVLLVLACCFCLFLFVCDLWAVVSVGRFGRVARGGSPVASVPSSVR